MIVRPVDAMVYCVSPAGYVIIQTAFASTEELLTELVKSCSHCRTHLN